ncbi:MAG: DUF192 domain-containing protein [Deltaproteobacteria bacterium]|nr:DUF192 domain-containing protein [Deltaproteobacteria bacterium]
MTALVRRALAALLALHLGAAAVAAEKRPEVVLDERIRVAVDVVETPALRERGLSGRADLGEHEGMLFLFPTQKIQSFWMKEMNFAIDILWVRDGQIVGMSENLPPPPRMLMVLPRYASPVPCDIVLEVRAGQAKRWGLAIGDSVRIER